MLLDFLIQRGRDGSASLVALSYVLKRTIHSNASAVPTTGAVHFTLAKFPESFI